MLTVYQQLYMIALHVMWVNQYMFSNFYLQQGGMHLLTSYVGCVGSLINYISIIEFLEMAFTGDGKMLTGSMLPDNIKAI